MSELKTDEFHKDLCDLIDLYASDEQERRKYIRLLRDFEESWRDTIQITGATWEHTTLLNVEVEPWNKELAQQHIDNEEKQIE